MTNLGPRLEYEHNKPVHQAWGGTLSLLRREGKNKKTHSMERNQQVLRGLGNLTRKGTLEQYGSTTLGGRGGYDLMEKFKRPNSNPKENRRFNTPGRNNTNWRNTGTSSLTNITRSKQYHPTQRQPLSPLTDLSARAPKKMEPTRFPAMEACRRRVVPRESPQAYPNLVATVSCT